MKPLKFITVMKDGSYQGHSRPRDAAMVEADPDWFCTIDLKLATDCFLENSK